MEKYERLPKNEKRNVKRNIAHSRYGYSWEGVSVCVPDGHLSRKS